MFELVNCVGGSLKWGGLANAEVIKGGGGRLMLTVADRGRVNISKILLTSYVNAPISRHNL